MPAPAQNAGAPLTSGRPFNEAIAAKPRQLSGLLMFAAATPKAARAVHAIFRLARSICRMAKIRALAAIFCLCGLLSTLGASAAWADGFRFGGWRFGPRFWGQGFSGPRYDGPPPIDAEPLPDDYPEDNPGMRPGPLRGPPPGPPNGPPGAPIGAPPPGAPPFGPRKCYSPAETRERVASAGLREPFALMRKASAMTQSEALAGKLCRWNDLDIYDISLLRNDGALIHVYMNAATGQVVGGMNAH
jgi:hypothetical protein